MARGYNSSKVRGLTGISQRCLDYWDERGIVSPSIRLADGKGSERRYSFEDLVRLRVVKHLREMGLSLQRIREAVRKLKKRLPTTDPWLNEVLVTDGKTVFRQVPNGELADVLADGQLVLNIVRVGLIREDVRATVLQLERQHARYAGRGTRAAAQGK